MKALALLLILITPSVALSACPTYTHEQDRVLHLAYYTGAVEDLGYTLAAIVIQESFVGGYVVRINEGDSGGGSYGISHIQLKTAMWLTGEDNVWRAKQDLVPKLISSDAYALHLAILKLQSVGIVGGGVKSYLELWGRYNGGGQHGNYAHKIHSHVKMLQECYNFNEEEVQT